MTAEIPGGNRPTRLWLIRHAPVPAAPGLIYGRLDLPCSTGAPGQMAALARLLPAGAVWVITPLRRSRDTALALRAERSESESGFVISADLTEQDFGRWQGLTHDELAARADPAVQDFWQAPARNTPPGGESFVALAERVKSGLLALCAAYPGRDLVIVAHAGTIRAALALALDLSPESALCFSLDPLSLTRLDHFVFYDPDRQGASLGWRVGGVNLMGQA